MTLTTWPTCWRWKTGKAGSDTVEYAFDVDVDHRFPVVDPQRVESRDWTDPGVVDQNIEASIPLAREVHQTLNVLSPDDVDRSVYHPAASFDDLVGNSLQPILSPSP